MELKLKQRPKLKGSNCKCDYCKQYQGYMVKPKGWKGGDITLTWLINRCSTKSTWVLEPFASGKGFIKVCMELERNYLAFNANKSNDEKIMGLNKVITTADPATFMIDHLLSMKKSVSLIYIDITNPKSKNALLQSLSVQAYEMLMVGGYLVTRMHRTDKKHTSNAITIDALSNIQFKACIDSQNTNGKLLLNYIWKKEK